MFVKGSAHVNASDVPRAILRSLIRIALTGTAPQLFPDVCRWGDSYGGDVTVTFALGDERAPAGPDGYRIRQLRFVSPR